MDNEARRKQRVRAAIRRKGGGKPRLSVFKSNKHIYAQIIDDINGVTIAAASTHNCDVKGKSGMEAAKVVGEGVAQAAKKAKVSVVVFDRGGRLYHGRVKALADGARAGGLVF